MPAFSLRDSTILMLSDNTTAKIRVGIESRYTDSKTCVRARDAWRKGVNVLTNMPDNSMERHESYKWYIMTLYIIAILFFFILDFPNFKVLKHVGMTGL